MDTEIVKMMDRMMDITREITHFIDEAALGIEKDKIDGPQQVIAAIIALNLQGALSHFNNALLAFKCGEKIKEELEQEEEAEKDGIVININNNINS